MPLTPTRTYAPSSGSAEPGRLKPRGDGDPEDIGPYHILGILGAGGMGVVYLAEQRTPVHRRVALKVIRLELRSREILARFEAERQALARMTHAGIAKIYDAGTSDGGQPFFAMEYVDGPPITTFCAEHSLPLRERVRLFVEVCEAIHHAHLNAVIHRDLSPQNILVIQQDGSPAPKIIDFGIAKSLDEPLTERTYFTHQHAILGKPAYMPPEQAGLSAAQVNATADIYSLGVVLYELVAGALPFDRVTYERAFNTGYDAMLKLIRELEAPKPSARVAQLGPMAERAAAAQGTSVYRLVKSLRGELDWICMRAIDKDSGQRYASASELAADLRRYLNGEPVLAGPPSTWYRLRKSVRRHRGAFSAGAAVVVSLAIGLSVATTMYLRAEHQRKIALWQGYLASIRAAAASLQEGEVGETKRWLSACDPGLRGWEWDNLFHRTDASLYSLLAPPWRVVWAGFNPDGRSLAATSADGTVRIWSWGQGKPNLLRTFQVPSKRLCLARFSQDGRRLAVGCIDSTVTIWDLNSGAHSPVYRGSFVGVLSMAWSPDGRRLAVSSDLAHVSLLDPGSGVEPLRIDLPETGAASVVFSNDGRRIFAGRQDGVIQEFDAVSGRTLGSFRGHVGSVTTMAMSPDGRRLVSVSVDQTVRVWDARTRATLATLRDHKGNVNGVSFRPDGRYFATCSYDKTVRIWDAVGFRCVRILYGNEGYIYPVDYSPDGRYLVSGGDDERVRIWDLAIPENPSSVTCDTVITVIASVPGGGFVEGDARGRLYLWRGGKRGPERIVPAHHGAVTGLAASGNGGLIVSAGLDGFTRTWSFALDSLARAPNDSLEVSAMAVSPNGRAVALGSGSGVVRIWDRSTGRIRRVLKNAGRIEGLAFSPDGARLASTSWVGGLILCNTETHERLVGDTQNDRLTRVTFTPDGRRVITGSWYGNVRVWDAMTCRVVAVLRGHNSIVPDVAVSPDGRRIATVSQDRTLRLWDAASGEPLATLEGHTAGINALAYSAGGDSILTASDDRTIRIWRR